MKTENKIKNILLKEAEAEYKKFSSSLIPNIDNVLGIRLPVLRKIAKNIYTTEDFESFLQITEFEFMEEVMLQGMVIGNINKPICEILKYIKEFVPKINNWAVCDSFCCGLKFIKNNLDETWEFLLPYFKSKNEYDLRFAYVMLLSYFVSEKYLKDIFKLVDNFKDDRYYSQMAVAWLVSVCYAKFPEQTFEYLKVSNLEKRTYNKSIQKICESYRVLKKDKEILKKMKK